MNLPPPRPLYFGPAERACFGWLHAPAEGFVAPLGLVICPPFGFEEVCAHRSLRELAAAAARVGVPSLRVDLPGCGHSAGDDFQPQLWQAWQDGLSEAADGLRAAFGVTHVVFLGVRLGATLAMLTAAARTDVAGVVAIAPVMSGRAYLRELALLEAAASPGAEEVDGLVQATGFVLTESTAAALRAVDLRAPQRPPAPRMLLVDRDDLPASDETAAAFRRAGAAVDVARWPGYLRMMDDPQRCEVPLVMLEGIAATLSRWTAEIDAATPRPDAFAPGPRWRDTLSLREQGVAIVERPVRVPTAGGALFGVLAEPERAAEGQPALVMLTAGAVHAIGPNRLWVRLARRWAARGRTVLRVDLSGIGDSPPAPGAEEQVVYSRQALDDVRATIDFIRHEHGAGAVHLIGLCSGAYHALKAAVQGQPIAGAVIVNPLTYFWHDGDALKDVRDFEVFKLSARYRYKFFSVNAWRRLLRGQLDPAIVIEVMLRRVGAALTAWWPDLRRALGRPLREDIAAELAAAWKAGIRLHLLFACPHPGLALFQQQGGRAVERLRASGAFDRHLVHGADHTFTRWHHRERLVALIDRCLGEAVAPGA